MATTLGQTSGTVGQTVLEVADIIDHAVRRCGQSAAILTAEQQDSARANLFLILSNLATKGLSLWCVQQVTLGMTPGKLLYTLPVGTIDVLRALYRSATFTAATSVGAGVANLSAATPIQVQSALVTPVVAGAYELVLEGSSDAGANWVEVGRAKVSFGDSAVGVDATTLLTVGTWRVRDATDPLRVFSAGSFLSAQNDLQMSKLSRDDYANLPNKAYSSSWPLSFWYDKQFYQPQVTLWPAPSNAGALKLFIQRHIQDPGAYTNAVEVPQRWLDTIISLLAPRVCLELPKELVPQDRYQTLKDLAAETLRDAEDSETDGAPIRLAPNISAYTR